MGRETHSFSRADQAGLEEAARQDANRHKVKKSERVEDPEKAEYLARITHDFRSKAAEHRNRAKELEGINATEAENELQEARMADIGADIDELFAGNHFDFKKAIPNMPEFKLHLAWAHTIQTLSSIRARIYMNDEPEKLISLRRAEEEWSEILETISDRESVLGKRR